MEASQNETSTRQRRVADIYGTFLLDRSEFTLSVESIQEVVNYPERINAIPLSPNFLQGVFNLRGVIIPLVDMRRLLKFPEATSFTLSKVAIIDFEGAKLGLIFDSTGEILHVHSDQANDFSYTSGDGRGAVKGALKLEGGNRIVQVLDPAALLKIEKIPQVIQGAQKLHLRVDRDAQLRGPRTQCISFTAGSSRLAFDIQSIHEIIRAPDLNPSIMASENAIGMTQLRGDVLTVIDFVKLLGFRGDSPRVPSEERVVVIKVGGSQVGLLIDSVENIVSFYRDEVLPIPAFNASGGALFDGMVSRAGVQDLILLRTSGVFENAEIQEIVRAQSQLLTQGKGRDAEKKRSNGIRQVCIAFKLDRGFALPIKQIQEIIHYTENLIKPPGLPPEVKGVLNLRGQAITVIDMRMLYKIAPLEDRSQAKVLIVQRENAKYGLLVDSVESIVSYLEDQKLTFPKALLREQQDAFQNEVREIVEIQDGVTGEKKCMMILELERVMARMSGDTSKMPEFTAKTG